MTAREPWYAPEAACLWCEDCAPEDASPTLGGETDSPSHCDGCGVLLAEDLTSDGLAYVEDALRQHIAAHVFTGPNGAKLHGGSGGVLEDWREEYGSQLDSRLVAVFDSVRERMAAAKTVLLVSCEGGRFGGPRSGVCSEGAHWTELVMAPDSGQPDSCEDCGAHVLDDGWLCLDGGSVVCSSHVLTPQDARSLAADWHGGQSSSLYKLASTGYVDTLAAWECEREVAKLDTVRAPDGTRRQSTLTAPERAKARAELRALAAWCEGVRSYGYAQAMATVRKLVAEAEHGDSLASQLATVLQPLGLDTGWPAR